MLFKREILEGIAAGRISLVFRRWRRPAARPGGTLRTEIGVLSIESVDLVLENDIRERDARMAGFDSRKSLIDELNRWPGSIYRVLVRLTVADPRIELRSRSTISAEEFQEIRARLAKFDAASRHGNWTMATLRTIAKSPGQPAAELAAGLGLEKEVLKPKVRKLKELGLTESLMPGYRLSARGKALLRRLARMK